MLKRKGAMRFRRIALGFLLIGSPTFLTATTFLQTVEYVDLERFMGKWYVIACIPTPLEKNIINATETYRLVDDGTIATTFAFRKGGFNGPKKKCSDTQSRCQNIFLMLFIILFEGYHRVNIIFKEPKNVFGHPTTMEEGLFIHFFCNFVLNMSTLIESLNRVS